VVNDALDRSNVILTLTTESDWSGYPVVFGAVGAFLSSGGSFSVKKGNFPLWRAKRKPQNIASVKADMNSGSTYDLNKAIDMPPSSATVIRNIRAADKTVANIESRTALCSSAKTSWSKLNT